MRVHTTITESFFPHEGTVHRSCRRTLALAVTSRIEGNRANLTAIGRGLACATAQRYRMKRMDRLLGAASWTTALDT